MTAPTPVVAASAATTATGLAAHAAALQSVLADLNLVTVHQLADLFQQYGGAPNFADVLRKAFPAIVTPHAHGAALITAQWYDELEPSSSFKAKPVVDLPEAQMDKTLRWALHAPTAPKAPSELEPVELDKPDTTPTGDDTLGRLAGSTSRMIFDASRDTVLSNVREEGVLWARQAQPDACAFCRMLATRNAVYRTELSASRVVGRSASLTERDRRMRAGGLANTTELLNRRDQYARGSRKGQDKVQSLRGSRQYDDKYHDHCVPAGTLVSGPSTEAAYRRLYEGEAVVIHTASGQKLTITPNHPVLTDQGWIPAGLLNHGDHVIRSLRSDAGATAVPHEHQKPSLIEDVWGSLAVNRLLRMPGSAEDFHGDGMQREVEIVRADRSLNFGLVSALLEHAEQLGLAAALGRGMGSDLAILRQGAALLPAAGGAAYGLMGSRSQCGTLLGTCANHADLIGSTGIPGLDAEFQQATAEDNPLYAELICDGELRELFIDIETSDKFGIDRDPVGPRFDPAEFQFTADGRDAYARLGGDLMGRLAGQVETDCIVHLDRISFSDHVYNLQTVEGWYSADGLIVSNCRCVAVPVRGGDYEPPDYAAQWNDDYVNAVRATKAANKTKGQYGAIDFKAVLAHMRKISDAS